MRDVGLGLSLWCALTLACGHELYTDSLTSEGCPAGAEGCPCADRACDDGLVCVEGSCRAGGAGESTTTGAAGATTDASGTTALTTATSSGGATTVSATTTGATTGCEFICNMDVPGSGIRCDLLQQDCPEGQKCAAYDMDGDNAYDSAKCFDVVGDGQHGEPCVSEGASSGVDDCAEGVMCWDLNEEGEGTCVALCTGTYENPSCAPPNTECRIYADGSLTLCLPTCDPLQQDCVGDEVCIKHPNSVGFLCVQDASGGMAPEGTPCEFANSCNPGNLCVSPDEYPNPACQGSIGCCAPLCDLSKPDACAGLSVADAVCISYYEPERAPPEFENVGVCGVAS